MSSRNNIIKTICILTATISICAISLSAAPVTSNLQADSTDQTLVKSTKTAAKTQKLVNRYQQIWKEPELRDKCLSQLHKQNPEWDFMFRTYSVLSFCNLALSNPQKSEDYLKTVDYIISDTLKLEKEHGFNYFLLPYGKGHNWNTDPERSVFIDGEISLMIGARCLVKNNDTLRNHLRKRVKIITDSMKKSPTLCAESYPDEYWVFCNTIALASIKISDKINDTDHSVFFREWITNAKTKLIDKETGLLRSAFTIDGTPTSSAKGPEGSSIWMSCHMLQLIDEDFARNQYKKAKKELLRELFGFAYSREWPVSFQGETDIDSGQIIPYLNASPSASGLAIMCTSSFGDKSEFNKLVLTLNTFGCPIENEDSLYYEMSNPLGDSVILYGLTVGPVWQKANE